MWLVILIWVACFFAIVGFTYPEFLEIGYNEDDAKASAWMWSIIQGIFGPFGLLIVVLYSYNVHDGRWVWKFPWS